MRVSGSGGWILTTGMSRETNARSGVGRREARADRVPTGER